MSETDSAIPSGGGEWPGSGYGCVAHPPSHTEWGWGKSFPLRWSPTTCAVIFTKANEAISPLSRSFIAGPAVVLASGPRPLHHLKQSDFLNGLRSARRASPCRAPAAHERSRPGGSGIREERCRRDAPVAHPPWVRGYGYGLGIPNVPAIPRWGEEGVEMLCSACCLRASVKSDSV